MHWPDGSVLSDDPEHFAIVSNKDHYLFTKDGSAVHINGNPIADADPATFQVLSGAYAQDAGHIFYFADQIVDASGAQPGTFRVLNANFECSADQERAYYRNIVIADADPSTFPPGKAVTGCDETSIAFAD